LISILRFQRKIILTKCTNVGKSIATRNEIETKRMNDKTIFLHLLSPCDVDDNFFVNNIQKKHILFVRATEIKSTSTRLLWCCCYRKYYMWLNFRFESRIKKPFKIVKAGFGSLTKIFFWLLTDTALMPQTYIKTLRNFNT
jgi:hypothetical protein